MKAGVIAILTTGEYSDFGIYATIRALKDFDFDFLLLGFRSRHSDAHYFSPNDFLDELIAQGFVEHVTLPEFHIETYGAPEQAPEGRWDSQAREGLEVTWVPGCLSHEDCANNVEIGVICAKKRMAP